MPTVLVLLVLDVDDADGLVAGDDEVAVDVVAADVGVDELLLVTADEHADSAATASTRAAIATARGRGKCRTARGRCMKDPSPEVESLRLTPVLAEAPANCAIDCLSYNLKGTLVL